MSYQVATTGVFLENHNFAGAVTTKASLTDPRLHVRGQIEQSRQCVFTLLARHERLGKLIAAGAPDILVRCDRRLLRLAYRDLLDAATEYDRILAPETPGEL